MKKVFLLATAALLVSGVTFADNGKKRNVLKEKPVRPNLKLQINPVAKTKRKLPKSNFCFLQIKKPSNKEGFFV